MRGLTVDESLWSVRNNGGGEKGNHLWEDEEVEGKRERNEQN